MPDDRSKNAGNSAWWSRLLRLPNDDPIKMFTAIVALCIVSSAVVSTAAVVLRPLQLANKALDRKQNILSAAGLYDPRKNIDELFKHVEARIVDLQTGEYVTNIDPNTFDQRAAARDPDRSISLSREQDIAKIGAKSKYAQVYLVREAGELKKIILPVHGLGLWSTMYGFIALQSDANTIAGIKFYEHEETPGLGAEIDNPRWQALWEGKQVYDPSGKLRLEVIKGAVDTRNQASARYQIDGISGATLTGRGVSNMARFWLGVNGFGPYLEKLRSKGG